MRHGVVGFPAVELLPAKLYDSVTISLDLFLSDTSPLYLDVAAASGTTPAIILPSGCTFTTNDLKYQVHNTGLIPLPVYLAGKQTIVGWVKPGSTAALRLLDCTSSPGTWRVTTDDPFENATGTYFTSSIGSSGGGVIGNNQKGGCWCQLSSTNGIQANVSTTTLSLSGWAEAEGGKQWGTASTITVTSGTWAQVLPLTSTTALLLYVDNVGNTQAAVVSINTSTLALTVAATSQLTTDAVGTTKFIGADVLSSALVLATYATSAGAVKGATITISGTTATCNTVAASGVTTTGSSVQTVALSPTLAHTFFFDSGNGPSVMRTTISGTTVSFASAVVVKSSTSYTRIVVGKVDSSHTFAIYSAGSGVGLINANVVTDGTPVTVGTETANLFSDSLLVQSFQQGTAKLPCFGSKGYLLLAPTSVTVLSTQSGYTLTQLNLSSTAVSKVATRPVPFIGQRPALQMDIFSGANVSQFQVPSCVASGDTVPFTLTCLAAAA